MLVWTSESASSYACWASLKIGNGGVVLDGNERAMLADAGTILSKLGHKLAETGLEWS